jgi:hypothetical protein
MNLRNPSHPLSRCALHAATGARRAAKGKVFLPTCGPEVPS